MIIEITGVTSGQSPYDIFLCNTGGTSCFFVSGNTYIPPNVYIDTENYFPGEEKVLVRLIDTNGCVHEEIQDCSSGTTGSCICREYRLRWGVPGTIVISWDPCCPSGATTTQTITFPDPLIFSSSTTPIIISSTGGMSISDFGDLCPCT